ncbi:MAG: cell envelope integrity protein CreD [Bacteroidota bacterium]
METHQEPLTFWQRNKLLFKSFFIGFLILVLLIPTFSIMYLIDDREKRHNEVIHEVSNKWAGAQTITGPFLVIPYVEEHETSDKKIERITKQLILLPDELSVNGKIATQVKHRSIFQVPVYTSNIKLSGKFDSIKVDKLIVPLERLQFEKASVCVGISDFKGIGENLQLSWNKNISNFESGLPRLNWLSSGITSPIVLSKEMMLNGTNDFEINVSLKGSEKLFITPFGNTTKMHLESDWVNPGFDGKYLPDTSLIDSKGFIADWKILHFNRNYPQQFSEINNEDIPSSAFGVNLVQPVNVYSQTMRSAKYAILIIALTFFLYFFLEIFYRRSVHPLQYVLIGFALVIFYTLLLSISEYLPFSKAYLIAAVATISLIGLYTKSIFKKWSIVLLFSFILSLLYLFIYVLIQLQDNALLFGSIGLFILLSIIMYFSRKVSWSPAEKIQEATD